MQEKHGNNGTFSKEMREVNGAYFEWPNTMPRSQSLLGSQGLDDDDNHQ